MSSRSCQNRLSSLDPMRYEVDPKLIAEFYYSHLSQASKRVLARLEGHDDPKALHPWTQFLAAGLGGIISQSVKAYIESHYLTLPQGCDLPARHAQVVSQNAWQV